MYRVSAQGADERMINYYHYCCRPSSFTTALPQCGRLCCLSRSCKHRAQELCESRSGRPGLPVPNSPYGLCGREATLNSN